MNTTTVVIVIVALAALLLLAALARVARNKRNDHRHAEAETIREDGRVEERHVTRREALAEETAAKARAAQAEADVKTAQAKGLAQQAAGHRSRAATSRHALDERFDHADVLDPATPDVPEPQRSATRDEPQPTARPR